MTCLQSQQEDARSRVHPLSARGAHEVSHGAWRDAGPALPPAPSEPGSQQERGGLGPGREGSQGHAGLERSLAVDPAQVTPPPLQLRGPGAALQGAAGGRGQVLPVGREVQLPQRAGGLLPNHHHRQEAPGLPAGRGAPAPGRWAGRAGAHCVQGHSPAGPGPGSRMGGAGQG